MEDSELKINFEKEENPKTPRKPNWLVCFLLGNVHIKNKSKIKAREMVEVKTEPSLSHNELKLF